MPIPYNHRYDECIIEALFEDEKLGYRQIKKAIELKINRELSFETYNNHIKKLIEKGHIRIINNDAKRGQRIFYCLTNMIKQEIDLGIIQFTYDETY